MTAQQTDPMLPKTESDIEPSKPSGTQTLLRGLALLECVADGVTDVKGIAERLGTQRSTTHRMLSSLVSEGYLHHIPYRGYTLGPKIIRLGARAVEQRPVAGLARAHIEALARETGDTVHLGIVDGVEVFYLDKIPGTRGLEMRSRIGQRMPLAFTGVGKALMLGMPAERWKALYVGGRDRVASDASPLDWPDYEAGMREAVARGWVYDFQENEMGIHCIGAPIFDISGQVAAAVSVASAASHLPTERMAAIAPKVRATADAISRELGWTS